MGDRGTEACPVFNKSSTPTQDSTDTQPPYTGHDLEDTFLTEPSTHPFIGKCCDFFFSSESDSSQGYRLCCCQVTNCTVT